MPSFCSTSRAISAHSVSGSADAAGLPPAKEIMPGLAIILKISRMGAAADLVEAVRETQGIKRHNPITPYYFQRIRIKNTFSGQNPGKVTKRHGTTSVWLRTALKEEQSFLARCNRRTGCRLPAAQTRFQRMARSCTSPYAPPASSHRPEALCLRRRSG